MLITVMTVIVTDILPLLDSSILERNRIHGKSGTEVPQPDMKPCSRPLGHQNTADVTSFY